jgi:glycyl-tRNA synthetase
MSIDGLAEKAQEIQRQLAKLGFMAEFDESGSIGRRYARADEAGIQLGITVDYDSLTKGTVTIRDRDSWKQVLTQIAALPELLHQYFEGKLSFEQLGTLVEG